MPPHPNAGEEYFGVTPDMATYGKIIGAFKTSLTQMKEDGLFQREVLGTAPADSGMY